MACKECGTVFFSAAAKTLVERGETCAKCGGRLALAAAREPAPARMGPAAPPAAAAEGAGEN